jgi:hypothetical protein
MLVVTEADAAAIRAVYEQDGELSAVIEVRRSVPWHAGGTPRAIPAATVTPLRPGKKRL